ncbi:MAG: hypothetical protein Tsb0033_27350 [Winogradskyella sp.]
MPSRTYHQSRRYIDLNSLNNSYFNTVKRLKDLTVANAYSPKFGLYRLYTIKCKEEQNIMKKNSVGLLYLWQVTI